MPVYNLEQLKEFLSADLDNPVKAGDLLDAIRLLEEKIEKQAGD